MLHWIGFRPFSLPLGHKFLEFGKSVTKGGIPLHRAEFIAVLPSPVLSILEGLCSVYTTHTANKTPLLQVLVAFPGGLELEAHVRSALFSKKSLPCLSKCLGTALEEAGRRVLCSPEPGRF